MFAKHFGKQYHRKSIFSAFAIVYGHAKRKHLLQMILTCSLKQFYEVDI